MYKLSYTEKAEEDLIKLKRSEPKAFKKAFKLLDELAQHPTTGTGKPEQLKGDMQGLWSRRITDRHRIVYEIKDNEVLVLVLSVYGHYDDK